MKSIWIDLDNSPHVPLFVPIIESYRRRGIEVILTVREHSQTVDLMNLAGLDGTYTVVGRHYGANKLSKIVGLLIRAKQLVAIIRQRRNQIAVAVSHGSRSMVLAARWMGIPILSMYDYEGNETHLFNRLSDKVLVPQLIPDSVLDKIRLADSKRRKYPGLKEDVYVARFAPNPQFRRLLLAKYDLAEDAVLVVLRPPATTANYHDPTGEALLTATITHLLSSGTAFTLISPRTSDQADEIREMISSNGLDSGSCAILDETVGGLDLIYAADLVISGGGTMNREAAALGVPVFSIFAGPQGSLDKQMEAEGLITFVRNPQDVEKITLQRRDRGEFSNILTDRVERFVIEQIDEFL